MMQELCLRINLEFIGANADRFNSMQREWSQLLSEASENACENRGYYLKGMKDKLIIELKMGAGEERTNNQAGDFYYFESEKALNEFARMFYYYFNNDGAFVELDYADFRVRFVSQNWTLKPIQYLKQGELSDIKTGIVFCIELIPDFEQATAEMCSLVDWIENVVGDDVVFLLTILRIPKINKKEVSLFYVENSQTQL